MAGKPYATEGQVYIAAEELRQQVQALIDSGLISKNPIFDSVTVNGLIMLNDEGCLIDSEGNEIIANKQNRLISSKNIKTINGESILGEGNLEVGGGGRSYHAGDGIIITEDNYIKVDFSKVSGIEKVEKLSSDLVTLTNKVINDEEILIKKQDILKDSGEDQNIKTINGKSILGSGDLTISGELKPEYEEYLKKVTFKTPSISELTLLNASGGTISGGTYEAKSSFTVSKFKHYETNPNNIEGKLRIEGQNIDPVGTSTTIEFTSPITISSNKSFTLSGKDTLGGNVSKSVSFSFARYAYSNVTSEESAPKSGTKLSVESTFSSSGSEFQYKIGDYLYLYTSKSGMKVETNVLGQWVEVEFESLDSIDDFTQSNGQTNKMYIYRVGPFINDGSAKYRVK